jgi:hypothetical protein
LPRPIVPSPRPSFGSKPHRTSLRFDNASKTSTIQVELAAETSGQARVVAPWVAGFARGTDTVVIFPSRSPSYPHDSLDDVLRHEVAHILIARSSGGRPIPRWFNEGLALAAERGWRFRDQTQLLYHLVSGRQDSLAALNRLFDGSKDDQSRAYLLSGAIVRDLLTRHGDKIAGQILERMGRGAEFHSAFTAVIGKTPSESEADFWTRQHVWTNWFSILVSQETVWAGITLLAILAIVRRRRKNAEIARRWEEEEAREIRGRSTRSPNSEDEY